MQISRRNAFTTVKTAGGLLPADLLLRITEGDPAVGGLTPEAYHLAKSERLNEAANRAWNRLQGAWEGFKAGMEKLPEADAGTSLTRERWLLILFQELGYGRLQAAKAVEVGGKTYPISHQWQATPIHLVSFRQELDRRTPGARGAARVSPHSLVQELLNRSDDFLWGFASNGLRLRLLRDNASLTRAACVEFDLQAMMDSEAYSDFFLLYLLCHQSRVEVPEGKTPEHCWLEKWYNTSLQEGTRVLDRLRDGVEQAIEALGGGFIAHPANTALRENLRAGRLSTQDYYRQVLRTVYRLLFLFVAEDRDLLLLPAGSNEHLAAARNLYTRYYSTQRLRRLAERRRSARHSDLYRALRLVFTKLHAGCPELALPALGSFLFSPEAAPDLNEADIANADLLAAIWNLTFTTDGNVRRTVDYRNLGPEEFGSVYESLLEMHPEVNLEAGRFKLNVAAGSERKTSGSYYTPTPLVNCLLDSALDPVLDEACKKPDPEKALLDLKVCDTACGSGHFLIAAAHRIAKRLASVRAGEDEPAPESIQHALRDVIGHCIYGVDINPMAVELCKINLWLEALEPGKPLSFLDHHIRCGNSLLGATPALLAQGIPDEAFKPIEGDDRAYCTELKRQNRGEREDAATGQQPLFYPWERLGDLASAMVNLDRLPDDTPQAVRAKQERYEELVKSSGYLFGHLWADAWCAAFVWRKVPRRDGGPPYAITEEVFRAIERNPHSAPQWLKDEIQRLARQYQFFHWHLEFPDVFRVPASVEKPENEQTGWSGGFDCVLGNPPWERTALEDTQFFADRLPEVLNAPTTAARKRIIEGLAVSHPQVHAAYLDARRRAAGEAALVSDTGRFPLSASGRLNTYALFAELGLRLLSQHGRAGVIVQTGIATDAPMEGFWQALVDGRAIESIFDFENRQGIFPGVHRSMKFCLLTLRGSSVPSDGRITCGFFLQEVAQLDDPDSTYSLTSDSLALVNPNTKQPPVCRGQRDLELVSFIHRRHAVLMPRTCDEYAARAWRALMSAGSSQHYRSLQDLGRKVFDLGDPSWIDCGGKTFAALIEAKQIHQFDPAFATYDGVADADLRAGNPRPTTMGERSVLHVPLPRFWAQIEVVEEMYEAKTWRNAWIVGVRDVTNSTNERTAITCVLPRLGLVQPLNAVSTPSAVDALWIVGATNSFACDYVARQKTPGSHLNVTIFSQLPVPIRPSGEFWDDFVLRRVLELSCVVEPLAAVARDCGYDGPPFIWDEERRFLIRAELDAAFFHLYLPSTPDGQWKPARKAEGAVVDETPEQLAELKKYFPTPRDAVAYIMETFPIVKRKDIEKYGSYRTKNAILEVYDEMARVSAENAAGRKPTAVFQTRLDPPPGPPADAAGNFIPMAKWTPAIWARYKNVIHPPRGHKNGAGTVSDEGEGHA